jgi:hypothetical protein
MGWLTGYAYRAKIPCTATTAGAQTNYSKTLAVIKGSGSNSAGTIYLNNHALNWPNDIRFTKSDGTSLLDHYREEYDASDGTWWIELDSIASSGDTDFYIYYGKSSDSDGSNGENTFIFFDDFENGNFNRWTSVSSDDWSVQSTVKSEGSYAAKGVYGAGRILSKDISPGKSILVHQKLRVDSVAWGFYPDYIVCGAAGTLYALVTFANYFKYYPGGSYTNLPTATAYSTSTWYSADVAIDNVNQLFRWWIDGASKGSADLKNAGGTTIGTTDYATCLKCISDANSGGIGYIDQLWVRAYAYPEPAWATPNSEEADSGSSSIIPILMNQYRFRRS